MHFVLGGDDCGLYNRGATTHLAQALLSAQQNLVTPSSMFSSRLFCLLLLAVTVVASPVVEPRADVLAILPLTLQRNVTGGQGMVSAGRQRAQALRAYGHGKGTVPPTCPLPIEMSFTPPLSGSALPGRLASLFLREYDTQLMTRYCS